MTRNRSTHLSVLLIAVVLLLLPAAYMGAYYGMLDDSTARFEGVLLELGGRRLPEYHVKGEFVPNVFWPAHQIDRLIRPNYWGD